MGVGRAEPPFMEECGCGSPVHVKVFHSHHGLRRLTRAFRNMNGAPTCAEECLGHNMRPSWSSRSRRRSLGRLGWAICCGHSPGPGRGGELRVCPGSWVPGRQDSWGPQEGLHVETEGLPASMLEQEREAIAPSLGLCCVDGRR